MKQDTKLTKRVKHTIYIFGFDMESPMNSIRNKASKKVNKDMIKVGITNNFERREKEYKNTYRSDDGSKSHAILKFKLETKKNHSECRVVELSLKSVFSEFLKFGEYYDKKVYKKIKIFLVRIDKPVVNIGKVIDEKAAQYNAGLLEFENCVFLRTDKKFNSQCHPLNIARWWWIGKNKDGRTFNEINAPDSFYKRCLKEHGHGKKIYRHLNYDIKSGFIKAEKNRK